MSMVLREVPTMDIRRSSPEFQEDGYAVWDKAREAGPVVYAPGPLEGPEPIPETDGYLILRYRALARVMGNSTKYPQPHGLTEAMFGDTVFESIEDPHRHGELRGIWGYEFQRDTLRETRLELVERVVSDYLDPFLERVFSGETVDAVTELHNAIPISVMLNMMDLPLADRGQLHEWAEAMSTIEVMEGTKRLREYLGEVLVERKKDLRTDKRDANSDLISMMAGSDLAGTMTDSEIVANCTQLVFAGSGTTTALMSASVVLLAQHPDQRRLIAEDRSLMAAAIEEVLRFRGPGHTGGPRFVAEGDTDIEGFRVPEGALLVTTIGAANRDPERWERPAEFDILRESKQHLGFGFGMHTCLGANLARLETSVYLNRLLDRLPEWKITADIDLSKDPFFGSISVPIPSIPIANN